MEVSSLRSGSLEAELEVGILEKSGLVRGCSQEQGGEGSRIRQEKEAEGGCGLARTPDFSGPTVTSGV